MGSETLAKLFFVSLPHCYMQVAAVELSSTAKVCVCRTFVWQPLKWIVAVLRIPLVCLGLAPALNGSAASVPLNHDRKR